MASKRVWAALAAVAMTLSSAPMAMSQGMEAPQGHLYYPPYMPEGHLYGPDEGGLPPINSAEAYFNTQVDILQTEIYRRDYERSLFESEMGRHDLRAGPLLGPDY